MHALSVHNVWWGKFMLQHMCSNLRLYACPYMHLHYCSRSPIHHFSMCCSCTSLFHTSAVECTDSCSWNLLKSSCCTYLAFSSSGPGLWSLVIDAQSNCLLTYCHPIIIIQTTSHKYVLTLLRDSGYKRLTYNMAPYHLQTAQHFLHDGSLHLPCMCDCSCWITISRGIHSCSTLVCTFPLAGEERKTGGFFTPSMANLCLFHWSHAFWCNWTLDMVAFCFHLP